MPLTVFTIENRRKLQHHLNLPIQEVREGSCLWNALSYIEQLDATEGTGIAADIQARVTKLDELEATDGTSGSFVTAMQSPTSQASSTTVNNQFSQTFKNSGSRNGYTGKAASLESYKAHLIASIRRDLGMSQQTGGNTINAAWPGGHSEPRRASLHDRQWGFY
ncbi:MAG: hypothetical protein AAF810_21305 [Cyanobacteria bacterium P01_D01_bin.36]